MPHLNADQIRYTFLEAAYRELFNKYPNPDALQHLALETKDGK